jgi:hypothetical protein
MQKKKKRIEKRGSCKMRWGQIKDLTQYVYFPTAKARMSFFFFWREDVNISLIHPKGNKVTVINSDQ